MQKLFNKILVPVDFTSGSRGLLEKAAEIAMEYDCSIRLLHVVPLHAGPSFDVGTGGIMIPLEVIDAKKELELKMHKLSAFIPFIQKDALQQGFSIVKGTWNEVIIDMVNHDNYDLVLIGQKGGLLHKRNLYVNLDKIAENTNIPVITAPVNRRLTKLYSIVIPVTDFLPLRKLIYGIYLAHNYNTTLKLLGIENIKTKSKVEYYLKKACSLVNENCDLPVELEMVVSDNVAHAVSEFANLHAADLIIVNPGTQTSMPGFFSKLFGNILQKYSAPPVLTINPA